MADLIRLLPDHVANQIAAGEVVQRPASVVKELLENSVDAGATRIVLVVKDAGRTLVQVTDDGLGMGPADARLCFERHATSKIRSAEDLSSVGTKGFRGEALASIAAIAQVELRTREHDQEIGTRVLIEGSRVRAQEAIAGPPGTTISVRSLFYNTPARRQFLKSDGVELRHVIEEFQRVALAHPGIAFQLSHNGHEEFNLPAANQRQRITGLLGRKYDERLVPVEEGTDLVRVEGFVGKPEFARRSRGEQFFFVNRRFVRSNYLEHAVRRAYEELVAREAHPAWFLFLEVDPAHIDINIHPTKTEIKFRDDRAVYAIVHAAVRRALGRFNIVPSLDFEPEPAMLAAMSGGSSAPAQAPPAWRPHDLGAFGAPPRKPPEGWQQLFGLDGPSPAPDTSDTSAGSPKRDPETSAGSPDEGGDPAVLGTPAGSATRDPAEVLERSDDTAGTATRTMPSRGDEEPQGERPVFQLHGTYIIAQVRSGFVVVDQQRAHERILYERNLRSLEQGAGLSQAELFPRNIELGADDLALVRELLPELRALGLDIEHFGGRTVRVNGVPAEAPDDDPAHLLESVVAQLRGEGGALRNERHKALARGMARSMAMRRGRALSTAGMHGLIDRLFACEMPYATPGGKPVIVTFGLDELDQRFQR